MKKLPIHLACLIVIFFSPLYALAETFELGSCPVNTDVFLNAGAEIDDRTANLVASNETKAVFSTRGDATSPWATSSTVWTAQGEDIDWSGASPWNSNGGYNFAGTLITPRHIIFANHYQMGTGHTVLFVAPDNSIVTRTLTAKQSIAGTDITVGILDSDVPASIAHYPILSTSTLEAYVRDGVDESSFDLPIVAFDQDDHVVIKAIQKSGLYSSSRIMHMPFSSGNRLDFNETLIDGDSGNPMFLILGNKPVLLSSHYYSYWGPNYSYYRDEIEQAIDALGGGYDLSDLDLSCFNAPVVFDSNQSFSINTTTATSGSYVGTVTVEHNVEGDAPYFSISAGNGDGALAIDSVTGDITVASSSRIIANGSFPRSILVQAEDGGFGGRVSVATVGFSLSSYPHFLLNLHEYSLDENSATGTAVATIRAADLESDSLSYSILSGNESGAFSIGSTTGALTVANVSALDYETNPSFDLVVSVKEAYTGPMLSATTSVSISLNDLSTRFGQPSYSFDLEEDAGAGETVGQVEASVVDTATIQNPYYTITAGNDDGVFAIDSSTGLITVFDGTGLEYDTNSSYGLSIGVSEGSGLSVLATAFVLISVEEVIPPAPTPTPVVAPAPSSRGGRGGGGGGGASPVAASLVPSVTASQAPSLASLVQLLIALKVISPDKVALAQSFVQSQVGTPVQSTAPQSVLGVSRTLSFGTTGESVRALQRALNSKGFTIASSGPGSIGNESAYFGRATEEALKRFQCERLSICSGTPSTTGYGLVGPKTTAALN